VEAVEALLLMLEQELRLPKEYHLELITHPVGVNWRERHPTPRSQVLAIDESLVQSGPFEGRLLMNLHPVGFRSPDELCRALYTVCQGCPGLLLSSGRFYHYYGFRVLNHPAWLQFLAQLLMPCTLVSPRYVGHSLYRGFCALRLNKVAPHKAVVPHVIGRVGT
jgi:hypothetical protein